MVEVKRRGELYCRCLDWPHHFVSQSQPSICRSRPITARVQHNTALASLDPFQNFRLIQLRLHYGYSNTPHHSTHNKLPTNSKFSWYSTMDETEIYDEAVKTLKHVKSCNALDWDNPCANEVIFNMTNVSSFHQT